VFAPTASFLKAKFTHSYERFTKAFADFDGEHFRRAIRRFESALERQEERWKENLFSSQSESNLRSITKMIWPDAEMSFRTGEILAGIADDLDNVLASIFERKVTFQYEKNRVERRSDDEVWAVYNKVFARSSISMELKEHTIVTDSFEIKFEHSFKNGSWHALQPLSLDYTRPEGIRDKVTKWLGTAVVLEGSAELAKLYLLLGPPKTPAYQEDYEKAKSLLSNRLKVPHQIVEEHEAQNFAEELAGYMREHGVLNKSTEPSKHG
jgi:hypothetical protein